MTTWREAFDHEGFHSQALLGSAPAACVPVVAGCAWPGVPQAAALSLVARVFRPGARIPCDSRGSWPKIVASLARDPGDVRGSAPPWVCGRLCAPPAPVVRCRTDEREVRGGRPASATDAAEGGGRGAGRRFRTGAAPGADRADCVDPADSGSRGVALPVALRHPPGNFGTHSFRWITRCICAGTCSRRTLEAAGGQRPYQPFRAGPAALLLSAERRARARCLRRKPHHGRLRAP